jgi:hypothetical protein
VLNDREVAAPAAASFFQPDTWSFQMTEKSMVKADLVTSTLLLAMGIAIVLMSLQMPTMADRNQSVWSAPGVVPAFIGGMLILLNFSMFVRSLKRKAISEFKEGAITKGAFAQETTRRIITTLLFCVVYSILLGRLWFPIPTFLFITGFILAFEYDLKASFKSQLKKVIFAAILGIVSTILVQLVFQKLFLVNLP